MEQVVLDGLIRRGRVPYVSQQCVVCLHGVRCRRPMDLSAFTSGFDGCMSRELQSDFSVAEWCRLSLTDGKNVFGWTSYYIVPNLSTSLTIPNDM